MEKKTRRPAAELLGDRPAITQQPPPILEKFEGQRVLTPILIGMVKEVGGKLTLDAPNHLGENPLRTAGFVDGDEVYVLLASRVAT